VVHYPLIIYKLHSNDHFMLFNQAHAGQRLVLTWFHEIAFVHDVCMCTCVCVCPPPRLLITSSMIWYDIEPVWLVKQALGVSLLFIWQLKSWWIVYRIRWIFGSNSIWQINIFGVIGRFYIGECYCILHALGNKKRI